MKTFESLTTKDLEYYGIIHLIDLKAMFISSGNYENRKDEKSCSLQCNNDKYAYLKYKN